MPKKVTITPEVREVLANATVQGPAERPVLKLPGQLDRKLYTDVDRVLKTLGGRWNRGAAGHQFDRPFEGELAEALASGVAVDQRRMAEQFFTPPEVAAMVFERALLVECCHVLEPSAGAGALLKDPIAHNCRLTVVEQDPRLFEDLKIMLSLYSGATLVCGDFLGWTPHPALEPIDRVVMNPPFGNGAAMAHVSRALDLLRPGGVLVAIMPPTWTTGGQSAAAAFRGKVNEHSNDWEPLPAGSFRSADTMVATGILTIRKGNI